MTATEPRGPYQLHVAAADLAASPGDGGPGVRSDAAAVARAYLAIIKAMDAAHDALSLSWSALDRLTCEEADALATVYATAGMYGAAADLLTLHATGDGPRTVHADIAAQHEAGDTYEANSIACRYAVDRLDPAMRGE